MKLSQAKINSLINEAWHVHTKVNQDPRAKYRFGQALWNLLPCQVSGELYMTNKDFFYWPDERVAEILEIVYNDLVEIN